MTTPWFGYAITQGYGQNGEQGIDLATPFHTQITALYAGTVRWAGRTQWACGSSGGEVTIVCNVPGIGLTTSYYLHLDTVNVKSGDTVNQGDVIGLSGGQTSGGNWPVQNCPSQGLIYSTGPHTEFGFKASWVSGPGAHINPTFAITQARSGTLPATNPDGTSTIAVQNTATGAGAATLDLDPTALEAGLFQFYTLSSQTHRTITQPTGWDGICEALDFNEQWIPWNWFNLTGSLLANVKPWLIRSSVATIALLCVLFILWQYIRGPLSQGVRTAGTLGAMIAAPEAAPLLGAAQGTQEAPDALAK